MDLAVNPPVLPMLAKRVDEVPQEGNWIYEPKWDGFRVLVFRDHDEVLIQSRDEKPLNRYFPDMLDPLRSQLPSKCVVDGEIVIAHRGRLDFVRCRRTCVFTTCVVIARKCSKRARTARRPACGR